MAKIQIQIDGMSCGHCVMRVKRALDGLDGVTNAEVAVGQADVTFDEGKLQKQAILDTIVKAGYKIRE